MRPRRNHKAATRESGFTMIELLVATAMMVIVCGAAVTMLVSVMHEQPNNSKRADQIGEARNAIERITADIRQASKAVPAGRTGVTLTTYCTSGGTTEGCTVKYACAVEAGVTPTAYKCTKQIGTATATPAVTGLANAEVFCYVISTAPPACGETSGAEPKFVGVKVEFRTPGEQSFTVLEDGAALHNSASYKGS